MSLFLSKAKRFLHDMKSFMIFNGIENKGENDKVDLFFLIGIHSLVLSVIILLNFDYSIINT